jgi:hypothetical protein
MGSAAPVLGVRGSSLGEGFYWPNGYGGFSLSPSEVEAVAEYIYRQEEHHRVVSFQEEYRKLSQTYGIEYDKRYVWD